MSIITDYLEPRADVSKSEKGFPLTVFLEHFYSILDLYLQENAPLNQIFSLYIVRNMKMKRQADEFREKYVESFEKFILQENEVNYFFGFLEHDEKDSIQFLIKVKKRMLVYYGHEEKQMDIPLTEIHVKINDWIGLLKSFSFFKNENILRSIEKFKLHILEENENILNINALEFLKSVYSFYISKYEPQEKHTLTQQNPKLTTLQKIDLLKFDKKTPQQTDINLGKSAKRFGEVDQVAFLNQLSNKNQNLKQLSQTIYQQSRQKRNKQNDYYLEIRKFKETSTQYDQLLTHVNQMR